MSSAGTPVVAWPNGINSVKRLSRPVRPFEQERT